MNGLSEWKMGECLWPNETSAKPGAISFKVSPGLTERLIYLYASARRGTPSDWYRLDLEVVLMSQGTPVATLPATVANHTNNQPNKSTVTTFIGGGNPVQDSIQITIANGFAVDPNTAVLQPMRISAEIDEVVLNMTGYTGPSVAGWRAWLGCRSDRD